MVSIASTPNQKINPALIKQHKSWTLFPLAHTLLWFRDTYMCQYYLHPLEEEELLTTKEATEDFLVACATYW